jgi:hypothetical protein
MIFISFVCNKTAEKPAHMPRNEATAQIKRDNKRHVSLYYYKYKDLFYFFIDRSSSEK